MKLWDKGIATSKLIEEFTAGRDRESDLELAAFDVLGSIAHIRMLQSKGLLSQSELDSLEKELKKLYASVQEGEFVIEEEVEDVHSQVELLLTRALGETGKKIHTARSRNDQILVDLKLFSRERIRKIVVETRKLFDILISLSNSYSEILLPGYTHMQIAMPSSFGLWFAAFAESLADDMILLRAAFSITNQNPLGSAAGYGTSFPADRRLTTELLGFDDLHVNVINAQMNRGKMEKTIAFALGSIGSTLSKMAMDICLYSGENFGFLSLPDEFTTGSSIMPHKKNPDVFELIRARGNRLQSLSNELSLVCSNLPSGYHRDFQIIKESFIPAFNTIQEMLEVTGHVIAKIEVNRNIIDNNLYSHLFSVEEVNRLVKEGHSFREAYKMVAKTIAGGTFNPVKRAEHTHEGSMGNLCNHLIEEKMEKAIAGFNFEKIEKALRNLLE